ncbi:hypothetical protein ATCC90586_002487 [Pythium insidiosum]|nr:hypothetical protein ATCC90586_002487 [Pythium insidiosum]
MGEPLSAVDAAPGGLRASSCAAFTTALAPAFPTVHRSWAEFDAQLKAYSQATFQLYVVRTTTSVRRRNLRIAELSGGTQTVATAAEADEGEEEEEEEEDEQTATPDAASAASPSERALIPASWTWYSKTLMCTHGWKTRSRGAGKRCMAMVRSTGCPVKMCVTVQRAPPASRDSGAWQIVVTKHIRNHNHPLSKELFLFYTENRRIYDPELLALVGGAADGGIDEDKDDGDHALATEPPHEIGSSTARFLADALALSGSEDPSPVLSVAAPRIPRKAFDSWDEFQRVLNQYATKTHQCFRIRSTVSVQGKNAKLMSDGASEPADAVLLPEDKRWYSKLLICDHGWKRKSRSKLLQFQPALMDAATIDNSNACPAMIMARLQRDVFDKWRIVVSPTERTGALSHLLHPDQPSPCGATTAPTTPPTATAPLEIRVPRIQTHHESWDAFHACLEEYSEATLQSYRTRTTSSVKGRNQKLRDAHARTNGDAVSKDDDTDENGDTAWSDNGCRLIPEAFKWYSKTLTCTHGWKDRRRGSGKRCVTVSRSTACPAKICVTLQYLEDAPDVAPTDSARWRVVVTKHVAYHNHNLSPELYQHYRDNRRIYDPDLLTIDATPSLLGLQQNHASLANLLYPTTLLGLQQNHASLANLLYPTTYLHSSLESPDALQGASPSAQRSEQQGTEATLPDSAYVAGAAPGASAFINNAALMSILSMTTSTPTQSDAESDLAVVDPAELGAEDANQRGNRRSRAASTMFSTPAIAPSSGVSYASISSLLLSSPRPYDTPRSAASPQRRRRDEDGEGTGTGRDSDDGSGSTANKRVRRSTSDKRLPSSEASRALTSYDEGDRGALIEAARPSEASRALTSYDEGDRGALIEAARPSFATADQAAVVWSPTNRLEVVAMVKDDGNPMWRAPPIQRRHATWQAFTEHLAEYSKATFQIYRVRTTSSIAQRNARVAQQLQQQSEDGVDPEYAATPSAPQLQQQSEDGVDPEYAATPSAPVFAPASYEWYAKTFLCTHGWKQRRRGKGQRVSHHLRSTLCPAKICATLQRHPVAEHTWNVIVTKQVLEHNHEVSHAAFQRYSENRKVRDPELLAQAEAMWRDGQSRRKIFEFLKDRSQAALLMKDVHNLVQRWQQLQQQQVEMEEDVVND